MQLTTRRVIFAAHKLRLLPSVSLAALFCALLERRTTFVKPELHSHTAALHRVRPYEDTPHATGINGRCSSAFRHQVLSTTRREREREIQKKQITIGEDITGERDVHATHHAKGKEQVKKAARRESIQILLFLFSWTRHTLTSASLPRLSQRLSITASHSY